jgi:hypothetical protein
MPRSPKYVILDIDHLNGGSVSAVYGPFTERGTTEWLAQKVQALERDGRLRVRYVPGISLSLEDDLGIVRELNRTFIIPPTREKSLHLSPLRQWTPCD